MSLPQLLRRRSADRSEDGVSSVARSHVGRVRTINEDRVLDRPERRLWAVADGMGGHSGGDVAAGITVAALDAIDTDAPERGHAILAALDAANTGIRAEAQGGTSGSTVVVLSIAGTAADIFWAGDSRAYLIRDGRAERLTRDHSLVEEMVGAGLLTEAAAANHPRANVVTRALGVADAVDVEHARMTLASGDLFLLCSDGLSRSLDAGTLGAMGSAPLVAAADRLVAAALERDGTDNISLVLVRYRT